jgi:glycosyltransferase involved in cell wall biosynthesis
MQAKVTIGIPFFNNEQTLELSIRSVINQTFKEWELILIDDGSTDQSAIVAKKMSNLDSRIRLISDGRNKGLVYRLNQIIDLAQGEYIARMDSDDVMLPERLEKQIEVFINNSNVDIVSTAAYTIDENDNPVGIRDTDKLSFDDIKIFKKSFLIHPSILVKKEWYKRNKYNDKYLRAEDYELWCRTYKFTFFFRITEPLMLYREGNVSVKNYLLSMKALRMVYIDYSNSLTYKQLILLILFTYLKGAVYRFVGIFNLQYILSSKRNLSLNQDQINSINSFILTLKDSNQSI